MSMNRPFNQGMSAYRSVDIQTRNTEHDKHELVNMMFEGVLESAYRAQGAIQASDTTTKIAEIGRAIRIIQEGLRTSLDLESGGSLADNLAKLYDYCVMRLTQANAQNDVSAIAEVIDLIKSIADAWRQMRTGSTSSAPVATAAQAPSLPNSSASKALPAARRMGNLYSSGMAMAGA